MNPMLITWFEILFLLVTVAVLRPVLDGLYATGLSGPVRETFVRKVSAPVLSPFSGAARLMSDNQERRLRHPIGGVCSFTAGVRIFLWG